MLHHTQNNTKRNTTTTRDDDRDVHSFLFDLRSHGSSTHLQGLHPPHTIESAGADVVRTLRAVLGGAPHVLIGLSLGGKVALDALRQLEREQQEHCRLIKGEAAAAAAVAAAATQRPTPQQPQQQQQQQPCSPAPARATHSAPPAHQPAALPGTAHRALPLHCWVLDSQPGTVSTDEDTPASVSRILSFIARTPMPVANRQALQDALDKEGIPRSITGWLASGLVPEAPGAPSSPLRWGFEPSGAAALYRSYRTSDYWAALERPPPGVTLHVVRGQRSDRWSPEMLARLEAARAAWQAAEVHEGAAGIGQLRLHVLPNAGHWLQVMRLFGWVGVEGCKGGGCFCLQCSRVLMQQPNFDQPTCYRLCPPTHRPTIPLGSKR